MLLKTLVNFRCYVRYSSGNYGMHALMFTDAFGNDFYFSYRTLVAFKKSSGILYVRKNSWGCTTGKHLNAIDGGGMSKRARLDDEAFQAKFNEEFKPG